MQRFQGSAVLSSTSADHLLNQMANDPDFSLKDIAKQFEKTDFAMQSLSGFNDSLLSQQRSLQLRIGVSSKADFKFKTVTGQLTSVITKDDQMPTLSPQFNGYFNGVRAGYMKLSLQVMDPFGRKRSVDVQNTYVAESMRTVSKECTVPGVIYLQPRLAQPARLLWRWLAADTTEYDEMNSHPATTPVCGWLMPGHLSNSFFLYNAQGNPLGLLSLPDDKSSVVWQSAPGNQATVDANLDSVMQHENPHLRELALSLGVSTPARFRAFWQATDSAFSKITPTASESRSPLCFLVGRPLALVQASLQLERQGFPALDQTYATLSEENFIETDHAISDIQFPVAIGDLERLDDGLIGYFKSDASNGFDTSVFYSEAAPDNADPGVVKPDINNVLLRPVANSPSDPSSKISETKVLLLMDPRSPIHVTTGILPTQALAIPSEQYEDVLARISFTFLIIPLLRPVDRMMLPSPVVPGYSNSLITQERNAKKNCWSVDADMQVPPVNAVWQYSPQSLTEGWLRLNPELLRFSLTNTDGTPVVTAGSPTSMKLKLSNGFRTPITFKRSLSDKENQPDSGSVFFIHFGSLVPDTQVASIQPSAPGWQFEALRDNRYGNYWAVTPIDSLILASGESLSMSLRNVMINDNVSAQVRVYFDYDNILGCSDGVEEVLITVLPACA